MSLGALQLNSLFRKYTGQLSDIAMAEADQQRDFKAHIRDMDISQLRNRKSLSERKASQGMAHSGTALEENVNLEKQYGNARQDSTDSYNSNMSKLAKARLDAKANYDEGVSLTNLTELLRKQQEGI